MNYAPILLASAITTLAIASTPDPLAPRPNGMRTAAPTLHLITNATIHAAPGETIEHADILFNNGIIVAIGSDLDPNGATVWDIDGAHIYAGFIDPYIEVDAPMPPANAVGNHWSNKITPQRDALDIGLPANASKALREMGFTSAMIAPDDGIFRGWSAVVSTAADFKDDSMGDPPTYKAHSAMMMGFDRSSWPNNNYPNSHMGVVAMMRQTFIDAEHRARKEHTDTSCLDEIDPKNTTLFYETNHELEALLADKIATEFDHANLVIIDNGTAHRRLNAFADMGFPVIVPLRFPKTPDVFTVGGADSVDLATLQHHERAPANARWLSNSRINVSLTTSKGNDHDDFWDNLHLAIEKGLDPDTALAMITTNPSRILHLPNQGALRQGFIANLVVADGDLFDPSADAQIIDTWVDGRRHHINDESNTRFDGNWTASMADTSHHVTLSIDGNAVTISTPEGDEKARKVNIDQNQISFIASNPAKGTHIVTGTLSPDGTIHGSGLSPDQEPFQWTAHKVEATKHIKDYIGTWDATLNQKFKLTFKITKDSVTVIEKTDGDDTSKDITQETEAFNTNDGHLEFAFDHTPFGSPGIFNIVINNPKGNNTASGMGGIGDHPNKDTFAVSVVKVNDNKDAAETNLLPDFPTTPFGPYAYDTKPEQLRYLLTNATVWTQSGDGILENATVVINGNRIHSVHTGSPYVFDSDWDGPAPIEIDATDMHITPGIIDAHSHTGLFRFGVNESGQAVTAEVRIADSLDPGFPGWYRQLAGGVTTAQLLHGSANPMGGQSQTVKVRWNSDKPQDMFFEGAKPGIKFALGENVKQSNWGDKNTTRYPQTRMGVETLMRDRFTKAREYTEYHDFLWAQAFIAVPHDPYQPDVSRTSQRIQYLYNGYYNDTLPTDVRERLEGPATGFPPKRDLELETLAQILAGERLVHSHSYRQDEILMLCRIAEEFDFKIGTFQHGLETYKVAEIVKKHAIGTSIFSDWWAYKVEVTDAIPFAGPINHEVGLLTSYNSDSDDLARRMHVEAGKALKYSKLSGIDMTEQEALAFVTTNPAIQLGIIDRVGTLEPGKDADLVIWTGNPLSSLSRPEMTFVDGRLMFSREMDKHLRAKNTAERQRLIQNILSDGKPAKENDSDDPDTEHGHDHGPDLLYNNTQGDCGCNQILPAFNTDY